MAPCSSERRIALRASSSTENKSNVVRMSSWKVSVVWRHCCRRSSATIITNSDFQGPKNMVASGASLNAVLSITYPLYAALWIRICWLAVKFNAQFFALRYGAGWVQWSWKRGICYLWPCFSVETSLCAHVRLVRRWQWPWNVSQLLVVHVFFCHNLLCDWNILG